MEAEHLTPSIFLFFSLFFISVDKQPGDGPQVQLVAVQRAGAAAAHLPRSHQADPQKLPQSGSSLPGFNEPA